MGSVPSMFATHGLAADRIAQLGWALTLIGSAVSFVVVLVLLLALARRRPSAATDIEPDGHAVVATRWIVVGGALVPGVIVIGAFVYALVVQGAIAAPPSPPALTIEVVAHRWWWEVRYDVPTRAQAVATANEIHIPIGRPVRIRASDPRRHSQRLGTSARGKDGRSQRADQRHVARGADRGHIPR